MALCEALWENRPDLSAVRYAVDGLGGQCIPRYLLLWYDASDQRGQQMHSAMIDLTASDGGLFRGYRALPDHANGGSVVVLQEIFGLNANIRGVVDSLAANGYAAMAPDIFWRQQPGVELDPSSEHDRERGQSFARNLDVEFAVRDALVAGSHLVGLPGANGRLGAVGYCLGGKLAYLLATRSQVNAAISYYGLLQGVLGLADDIRAPLLVHVAENDDLCPPEAQALIADKLGRRENVTIMRYPDVGHAFARRGGQNFDASSAARADAATLELLAAKVA